MSSNQKLTSARISFQAAATLHDPNASAIAKSLAGSALAQSGTDRQTGAEMEEKAGRVLASNKYSDDTRELSASILSQSNKKR